MVCEVCNTGWMHDLEEKVKPFLKPMLTNKHGVYLDIMQQHDRGRWAVLKVLLMEHVMRKQCPPPRTTGLSGSPLNHRDHHGLAVKPRLADALPRQVRRLPTLLGVEGVV